MFGRAQRFAVDMANLEVPEYDAYAAAPSGDALLEDGTVVGLTPNQRRKGYPNPLAWISPVVAQHVLVLYVLWFVTFVIACCAMGKANHLAAATVDAGNVRGPDGRGKGGGGGKENHWLSRCQYVGAALYGDDVFAYNGHHYQIIGGNWVKMTWKAAEMDAWSRCYNGKPGYLASVDDAAENAFLVAKMTGHGGFAHGDQGWIGANDMQSEGTFAWLDGFMAGTEFYKDGAPLPGKYSNFAEGEPNENGEEDCVLMDAAGLWNDDSCYKQKQFFFVEFDA